MNHERRAIELKLADLNSLLATVELNHFAQRLVEKQFLSYESMRSILNPLVYTRVQQASHLMDSVVAQVTVTPHKFNDFVMILSMHPELQNLTEKLKETHKNLGGIQREDPACSETIALGTAGLQICFQELEGSDQCQLSRNTCSSLSSDPNPDWTLPFQDNTDNRPGGCKYVWSLVGIPRQGMVYRVCFNETEGSNNQCLKNRNSCSGWSNSPNWSLPFKDDTDSRSGGCTYQWRIEEQLISSQSSSISACRVCFQETKRISQCQGSRGLTCSGWSTSPAPTSPFRDDTDDRSGGCTYQWMLECI